MHHYAAVLVEITNNCPGIGGKSQLIDLTNQQMDASEETARQMIDDGNRLKDRGTAATAAVPLARREHLPCFGLSNRQLDFNFFD